MGKNRSSDRAEHERTEAARLRLSAMFSAHHTFIWRMLRRHGHDAEGAADLTQQAFLIAWERLSDIEPERERAFLFGTALRLSKAARRFRQRWVLSAEIERRDDGTQRADDELARQRALALAERVLAQLPEELLTVFLLFEIEGLPMREISELVEIPPGTVASRLRRARAQFRAGVARAELQRSPSARAGGSREGV